MGKEFEIKVMNIDIDNFKKMLKKHGGRIELPKHKMIRHVFHHPDPNVNGFVRLRKEAKDKTTLTCKIFNQTKYPLEYELTLHEPYENGLEFLKKSGHVVKSYQETAREKWLHPLAKEIVFDTWPGIPEFIEIDCENEDNLKELIRKFQLNRENIRYDGVDSLYEEKYHIPKKKFNLLPALTFDNYHNQLGGVKKRKRTRKVKKSSQKTLKRK